MTKHILITAAAAALAVALSLSTTTAFVTNAGNGNAALSSALFSLQPTLRNPLMPLFFPHL
jgi:hypothetical protein